MTYASVVKDHQLMVHSASKYLEGASTAENLEPTARPQHLPDAGGGHLGGKRAAPDQVVQPLQSGLCHRQRCGVALRIGRSNRLMRLLRILGLAPALEVRLLQSKIRMAMLHLLCCWAAAQTASMVPNPLDDSGRSRHQSPGIPHTV